jgi:streptogramin lyase
MTEIIDATGDGAGNPLSGPWGIAVDGSGDVYVTGYDFANAFRIDPNGAITEIIDSTGDEAGNILDLPTSIATDDSGNVYIAGYQSSNVFRIDPNGVITEIIDENGDGAGKPLEIPLAIAVDGSGKVYVGGVFSDNAFRIDPNGAITEIIDSTGDGGGNILDGVAGLAVDGSGNVYVSGYASDNVFKITPGNVITEIIDSTGDRAGNELAEPVFIAVGGSENVYVGGANSDNVFKIETACPIPLLCESVGIEPGQQQGASLFGGSGVPGGVDATFEDTSGGTLSATLGTTLGEDVNFALPTSPSLLWEIEFVGGFSGSVTLVFGYDDSTVLPFAEPSLQIYHFTGGVWQPLEGIVDTDANTITVTIDSFSKLALGIVRAQDKDQQKCINELNKNFAKVAKTQGKVIGGCIKDGSKGKLGGQSIEECITADNDGKVGKAQQKTFDKAPSKCLVAPEFGATDPNTVNRVAVDKELDLIHEIFGSDLDDVILDQEVEKAGAKCQIDVAKAATKCPDAKLKEFNKCKKNGLGGKQAPPETSLPFDDPTDLERCMGYDSNNKIKKACETGLGKAITEKCPSGSVQLSDAFGGGACAAEAATGASELGTCLERLIECQVCLALNEADALSRDCDEFDDAAVNGSCP